MENEEQIESPKAQVASEVSKKLASTIAVAGYLSSLIFLLFGGILVYGVITQITHGALIMELILYPSIGAFLSIVTGLFSVKMAQKMGKHGRTKEIADLKSGLANLRSFLIFLAILSVLGSAGLVYWLVTQM